MDGFLRSKGIRFPKCDRKLADCHPLSEGFGLRGKPARFVPAATSSQGNGQSSTLSTVRKDAVSKAAARRLGDSGQWDLDGASDTSPAANAAAYRCTSWLAPFQRNGSSHGAIPQGGKKVATHAAWSHPALVVHCPRCHIVWRLLQVLQRSRTPVPRKGRVDDYRPRRPTRRL